MYTHGSVTHGSWYLLKGVPPYLEVRLGNWCDLDVLIGAVFIHFLPLKRQGGNVFLEQTRFEPEQDLLWGEPWVVSCLSGYAPYPDR